MANVCSPIKMKRRIAIVSPFLPAQNGIADYIHELLPYHTADYDILAIVDDDNFDPMLDSPISVMTASQLMSCRDLDDVQFVYHIGNNDDHRFALPILMKYPGVVIIHDYCLSYLIEQATFPIGDRETYRNWAQHDHGAFGNRLADDFLRLGWRGRFMAYGLPLNGPILASATAVIAHSRYVQFKCAAARPGLPVHYIPHHVSPQIETVRGLTRESARQQLGLPTEAIIVTALGFIAKPKLIDRILASLVRLAPQVPDFCFVLAGQRKPAEYDVDRDIAASGMGDRVVVTDFLPEDRFLMHLVASDVIINLRYPTGGESSGTLTRALGLGRACLVLNHGPMGELPEEILMKVDYGPSLEADLDEALCELMTNPARRNRLEEASARYSAAHWTAAQSASRYHAVFENTPPRRRVPPPPPLALGSTLVTHRFQKTVTNKPQWLASRTHWWRYGAAPLASHVPALSLLAIEDDGEAETILTELFGWPSGSVLSLTPEAFEAGGAGTRIFDYCVFVSSEEAATVLFRIGVHLMARLRRGATLVIEGLGADNPAGSSAVQPEAALEALGLSGVRRLRPVDQPPEFESDISFSTTDDPRIVLTGTRTSEIVARLSPGRTSIARVGRITETGGEWMLSSYTA